MNKILLAVFLILQIGISSVFADKPKLTEEEILEQYSHLIRKHDFYKEDKDKMGYSKGGYELSLTNGKKHVLYNHFRKNGYQDTKFILRNYLPKLGYFVFFNQNTEISYGMFVNQNNGEIVNFADKVIFSSNNQYILSPSYLYHSITIFKIEKNNIRFIKNLEINFPTFHSWIGSKSARIESVSEETEYIAKYILYYDKHERDWFLKETQEKFPHKADLRHQ